MSSSNAGFAEAGKEGPPKISAKIMVHSHHIDALLVGGIRCGMITEIFGESGSGKTQIVLQLALNVQLPPQLGGLYGVAVYYYCDYKFPINRLLKLRDAIRRKHNVGEDIVDLENVVLCKVEDGRDLCYKLRLLRGECLQRSETARHLRLVVVDGIASLFRSQFMNTKDDMSARKTYFREITEQLNGYANEFNFAVVITNQVSDVVDGSAVTTGNTIMYSRYGQRIQPCMGSSWASCIHTRIFIGIKPESKTDGQDGETRRKMQIVFSNQLEVDECSFSITEDGLL